MGMDSKTRELLTLWRDLSPEAKARMLKRRVIWLFLLDWKRRLNSRCSSSGLARTSTAIDSPS